MGGMADPDKFNAGLTRMGHAIRRAPQAFSDADDAFEEAMRARIVLTEHKGSLDEQIRQLTETSTELKRLIMEQGEELRALRQRLNGHPDT